jgi:hypothetical protein
MIAVPIGTVGALTVGMDRRGGRRVCGRERLEAAREALMPHSGLVCVTVGLGSGSRQSVPNG